MGYTNYYYTPQTLDVKKFKTLSEELKVATGFLAGHHSSANDGEHKCFTLCSWDGTGEPEFTEEDISFNGDQQGDLYHESFVIQRVSNDRANEKGLVFNFCKTARKPYDLMVQISMLRLKHHFPECEITSDGSAADWKNGRALYKKIFKENPPKMNQ